MPRAYFKEKKDAKKPVSKAKKKSKTKKRFGSKNK